MKKTIFYDESTNPSNGWRCPERHECGVCGSDLRVGDHTHEGAAGCTTGMVMPDDDGEDD